MREREKRGMGNNLAPFFFAKLCIFKAVYTEQREPIQIFQDIKNQMTQLMRHLHFQLLSTFFPLFYSVTIE